MRKSLFCSVFCFALSLNGCTATAPQAPAQARTLKQGETCISYSTAKHYAKPGNTIAFYPQAFSIKRPYRIIGKETVSRYNVLGMERQPRSLDELLRRHAASMGGDAVMNISKDSQKVEATVISFEKVLL